MLNVGKIGRKLKERSELKYQNIVSYLSRKLESNEISQQEYDEFICALEEGNIKKITLAFLYTEAIHKSGGLAISGFAATSMYLYFGESLNDFEILSIVLLGDTSLKMCYSYVVSKYLKVPHAHVFAILSSIPVAGKSVPLLWLAFEKKAFKVVLGYRKEKVQASVFEIINSLKKTVI